MNGKRNLTAALTAATVLALLALAPVGCGGLKAKEKTAAPPVDVKKTDFSQAEIKPEQLDQVKRQIKQGEKVQDPEQVSALLFMAALAGNDGLIKVLLKNGGDINAQNKDGLTALHLAVLEGSKNAVKLLLGHGADLNTKRASGALPLYDAVDNVEMCKLLLEHGANVNAREDAFGFAPLHVAITENKPAVMDLLIKNKAEVDAKSLTGIAPLHLAAQKGNVEMVKMLLEAGADPNIMSKEGTTPYKAARQVGKMDAAELIHEWGGN